MKRSPATLAVLVVAISLVGCADNAGWTFAPDGGRSAVTPPPPATQPVATASPVAIASPGAGGPVAGGGEIVIESFDLGFRPSSIEVAAPGTYNVTLNNTGQIAHDVTFADGTHIHAEAGQTTTATVDIPSGGLDFICSITGHEEAGMTGSITVAGTANSSPSPSQDPNDHGGPAPGTDVVADPNAPPPVRHDPIAPARLEGEVHDIDLIMTEQEMTVAEGFVQRVWTFNGTVPGPVIRVKVGDTIRV
ncbi:MAG: plastocyanin/azurin family copper-binding protein, partial [Chloroflexota bacterium]